MRLIPQVVFFAVAGIAADRYNRCYVALFTAIIQGTLVALQPFSQNLWTLYALIFLQFGVSTAYGPARRGLIVQVVPKSDLHLCAALGTVSFAGSGALAASIGGFLVSTIGPKMCFLLDSMTFVFQASCAVYLNNLMQRALPSKVSLPPNKIS